MTALERAIPSQPAELELAAHDLTGVAARLEGRRRVWLVGTGSSQHAAELGAMALAEAGLDARWSGSSEFVRGAARPQSDDAVLVISHTARTSFAVAAREAALTSGAEMLSITGIAGGWQEAIETVPVEESDYTVSVTAALLVLLRLAHKLGAAGLSPNELKVAIERVRAVVEKTDIPAIEPPDRALVLVGAGARAASAREGAMKFREAERPLSFASDAWSGRWGGAGTDHAITPASRRVSDGPPILCRRDRESSRAAEAAPGSARLLLAERERASLGVLVRVGRALTLRGCGTVSEAQDDG
jgi:glucosamine--fructose-6-phosphate aminotransferase (isomerizing)